MSYKCITSEKKVNILLGCLRQSTDGKIQVMLYNIISKTLCGRLCTPDYCNQKRLNQPETDMLSATRVPEKWRA